MLKLFHKVAIAEGISLLLLLGVAMPLKYALGLPEAVKFVGRVHGALFMAYVALLGPVASECGWSLRRVLVVFIAASVPFAAFYVDRSASVRNPSGT